jgi:diguanylate cyclase
MTVIKELLLDIFKNKKWINIFFYTEFALTILVISMLGKAKVPKLILLVFLGVAIVSNLLIYHLSEKVLAFNSMLDKLKEEAAKDYLTGLNNVRSFDRAFNSLLNKARQNDESIALLTIDVDLFKKVNDNYGHMAGDSVLRELAAILGNSIRDFDVVARVGGEEFSVILRDCGAARSKEIAERIRKNVEGTKFNLPCGNIIEITISVGIAVYPATIADIDLLKEKADEKLYEAKRSGRNKVCI